MPGTLVAPEAIGFPYVPGVPVPGAVNAVARFATYLDHEERPERRAGAERAARVQAGAPGVGQVGAAVVEAARDQVDPVTGRRGSLLRGDASDPLLIEVNTSTEYWQKGGFRQAPLALVRWARPLWKPLAIR
jgi:hypothetical protein